MATFDTNHVKNIALLGHAGSGKTTLAEDMIFEAGLIDRMGTVQDGTTMSDYHELEQERGNSIFSSLLHTRWDGYKINILDTPGYDDFVGEVIRHFGWQIQGCCCSMLQWVLKLERTWYGIIQKSLKHP